MLPLTQFLTPHRTVPRPRRSTPLVILCLLAPLFRYSDWRNAWILRIIGERWGPVLIRSDGFALGRSLDPQWIEVRSRSAPAPVSAAPLQRSSGSSLHHSAPAPVSTAPLQRKLQRSSGSSLHHSAPAPVSTAPAEAPFTTPLGLRSPPLRSSFLLQREPGGAARWLRRRDL